MQAHAAVGGSFKFHVAPFQLQYTINEAMSRREIVRGVQ